MLHYKKLYTYNTTQTVTMKSDIFLMLTIN